MVDGTWCPSTWSSLVHIAKETSVESMLNFIIEGDGDAMLNSFRKLPKVTEV